MGYVKELDDVLFGQRQLGMWMENKVWNDLGDDWPYLMQRFRFGDYDEVRYVALEGGAYAYGSTLTDTLKVVCRHAYGPSAEAEEEYPHRMKTGITMEWIVGTPEKVDEHLANWQAALDCSITAKEYQIRTGLLLGYDEKETKDFAESNKDGRVCRCTQCIPRTANNEWWARLELKQVRVPLKEVGN